MSNDIKNNLTDNKFFLLYLKIIICFFFVLILTVALINYKIDPENRPRPQNSTTNSAEQKESRRI